MLARSRVKPSEATSLTRLLAAATDGGFAIDADARIVLWNHAAESMLGYTVDEAVGRHCCELLMGHDDNGNPLCCRTCHVGDPRNTCEPVSNFDMRARTKAGSTIWMNVTPLVVSNAGIGDITIYLFRDVTATQKLLALIRKHLSIPAPLVPPAPEGAAMLTRRESEILRIISRGLDTKATAAKLHVSPATIRNHVQNILGKLGAHSRLEAVAYATRHRLI